MSASQGAASCPVGTYENSPVIYRWVMDIQRLSLSPVGTAEPYSFISTVPTGQKTESAMPDINPNSLKSVPFGWQPRSSRSSLPPKIQDLGPISLHQ